jgi:hypothetical protein
MFLGHDIGFWIALIGAALIRVFTSTSLFLWGSLLTAIMAVFSGYFLWEPVLYLSGFDEAIFQVPAVILCTLTGEGVMRSLIHYASNPSKLLGIWKILKGHV